MDGKILNIKKQTDCPSANESEYGIKIAGRENTNVSEGLIIYGTFKLKESSSLILSLHRALVIVVTKGSNYYVDTPFQNIIVLDDEIERHLDYIIGHFSIDVFKFTGLQDPGEYYVCFSMGHYLSNTLKLHMSLA